jgi:arginyl-tRNA--protein-N-Asp/Glu arginylyltransferase
MLIIRSRRNTFRVWVTLIESRGLLRELFRIVEQPRRCSYLPWQTASLEVRAIHELSPAEYGDLLARGWRRFGWQLFRPACPECRECRSIRVLAQQFSMTAGQRRVFRKNAAVRAELHPLFAARETVELYNRYQRFMHEQRGWQLQQASAAAFRDMFISGPVELGRQWLYFAGDKLLGVAMMDLAPQAVSLVYFFHDPAWRTQSPGIFSVLNQILYAKSQGLQYAYAGYWIEECQSMNYKNRFGPHEMLDDYVAEGVDPVWRLC